MDGRVGAWMMDKYLNERSQKTVREEAGAKSL